ncbi:MAG: SRPBCC domain-containing protein [Flavisolibacter sp.]
MKKIIFILTYKKWSFHQSSLKGLAFFVLLSMLQYGLQAQMKLNTNKQTSIKDTFNSTTIHQEVDFKINPEMLYGALLDSKQFSNITSGSGGGFSANSAKIDNIVGGVFSLFDGHITGRILELIPNKRIVEAWRAADWPEGVYSIAKFELKPMGSGTHLVFDHTGFPDNLKEHLAIGWQQHYWDAINFHFH